MVQKHKIPPRNFLKAAIAIVGGQEEASKIAGKSQKTVSNWLNSKKGIVPAEVAVQLEKATGGRISRLDLRPDLYADFVNTRAHDGHSLTSTNQRHPENITQIPAAKDADGEGGIPCAS